MLSSLFRKKAVVEESRVEFSVGADLLVSTAPVKNVDQLEPTAFPEWSLSTKPKNSQYFETKRKLVEEVFDCFRPYYNYIINIEEIRYNDSIKNAIQQILKNFISYFWDAPASEEYHHAYSFGLLQHSLEVACKEIEVAKTVKSYGRGNLVDSQATKARMPYHILGGFMVGLFHDAGKIFDLEYSHNSGGLKYVYNPFKGDLLDFYMCYPKNIEMKWKVNRHNKHKKRNLFLMLDIIDRNTLLKTVPSDVLLHVFDRILSYEQLESDHSSVANYATKSGCIDSLKNAIGEKYANKLFSVNDIGKSCVYKVDKNYYMCTYPLVINKMAGWMSKNSNTILQWIKRGGYLAFNPQTGQFRESITIYFNPSFKVANPLNFDVIFIKASLFDDPICSFFGQDARPEICNVKISREDHVKIEGIFYDIPLSNGCLWPPMSGEEAKKFKDGCRVSNIDEVAVIENAKKTISNVAKDQHSRGKNLKIGSFELSIAKDDQIVANEDVEELFKKSMEESSYNDTKASIDVQSILTKISEPSLPSDLKSISAELKEKEHKEESLSGSAKKQVEEKNVEFDPQSLSVFDPDKNSDIYLFVKFLDEIGTSLTINDQYSSNNVGFIDLDKNIYFNFPETVDKIMGNDVSSILEKDLKTSRLEYLSKLINEQIVLPFTHDERNRPYVNTRQFNKYKCRIVVINKNDLKIETVERHYFRVSADMAMKLSDTLRSVISPILSQMN